MNRRIFIVALGAALASPGAKCGESVYLESIQCVGGRYGLVLPKDVRQLKSLSKLLRESVSQVEHWDGYTATRKTLFFDGLELGIAEFSNDPARVIVTHAEVSKPSWNRLSPFKLGRPAAEAQALIGESAKGDDELKNSYGSDSDSVDFQAVSGVVIRVSYSCYSG
ncbi:hypothetical protein LNV08_13715 [Paucibacter sp. TC2R-5]|uniref:hypothetical protein n=1 Tax=Paucibacter sp. TC2R-5 TaxID=2893555 RepID=UPI0021E43424|nr:hypothetical protein [Paucibacter sp. TC2R-5]MCV2360030.1 hypothetical protein [Paucibacter sp. TC2R-5]